MRLWRDPKLRFAWTTVLVWSAAIWSLGGDSFAQSETSRILKPLYAFVFFFLDAGTIDVLVDTTRRSAHLVEYGILALLALRAASLSFAPPAWRAAVLALLWVVGLAAADEIRQGFSSERTGALGDVLLDASGGVLAVALVLVAQALRGRPFFESSTGSARAPEGPAD